MMMMVLRRTVVVVVVTLVASSRMVHAVVPTLALDITVPGGAMMKPMTMLLSNAAYGPRVATKEQQQQQQQQQHPLTLTYVPTALAQTNALLCQPMTVAQVQTHQLQPRALLMVPRGTCSFETKTRQAQALGAAAVIVYGTLASRYTLNTTMTTTTTTNAANTKPQPQQRPYTTADIIYPLDKMDYDCGKGEAWIDASSVILDDPLPYNAAHNDPVLSGSSSGSSSSSSGGATSEQNQCHQKSDTGLRQCDSMSCLLTGNTRAGVDGTQQQLQACCAWDLHIWLYPDYYGAAIPANSSSSSVVISIPTAYMTMTQERELRHHVQTHSTTTTTTTGTDEIAVSVLLYARWRPLYNVSAVLLWILGTAVAATAAYLSASDYRAATRKEVRRQARLARHQTATDAESVTAPPSLPPPPPSIDATRQPEEVLELTAWHAAGFVVMASTSLLVLFYFKIYGVVKVFYAFGCSSAVAQVLLFPLYTALIHKWAGYKRDITVWATGTEDFGDITVRDIVTYALGFGLGAAWLIMAFTVRDAESKVFFWVMQDVFGACMCISFLKVIRLNSIRVASILLIVAFFYDIFFVFVTPYLFGKSVMITVATSGGPPKQDALWCEKYPDDADCQGGNPLPMLLAIPKLFDFVGGSSLLGLGDIVLPGLLLSFAARYDAAKCLLGVMGGGRASNQSFNCPEQDCCNGTPFSFLCRGGYYAPLIVAYAIGLAMANTAVYVMNMGQPALLYLVPCCLGTLLYIGWRRQELQQLWDGPRVLRAADDVVMGPHQQTLSSPSSTAQSAHHTPIPVDERNDTDDDDGNALTAPPSAVDDDDDDNDGFDHDNKRGLS